MSQDPVWGVTPKTCYEARWGRYRELVTESYRRNPPSESAALRAQQERVFIREAYLQACWEYRELVPVPPHWASRVADWAQKRGGDAEAIKGLREIAVPWPA